MNDINIRCLEIFPQWLANLGKDVLVLQSAKSGDVNRNVKQILTGGINYLFKSLDLVPDGIDDIGYLDDAFVLRMSAKGACQGGIDNLDDDLKCKLGQLSEDTALVKELLGDSLFARFETYTNALSDGSARGRTVEEILDVQDVAREFSTEVVDFINTYESPGFSEDEKNIIKLKAFMEARLPR